MGKENKSYQIRVLNVILLAVADIILSLPKKFLFLFHHWNKYKRITDFVISTTIVMSIIVYANGSVSANQNSFADRIAAMEPNVEYITDNIMQYVTVDVYKISYNEYEAIKKHDIDINAFNLTKLERCISNDDYAKIQLVIDKDRKKLHPNQAFCFMIILKDKMKLSEITTKHQTFLTDINGKLKETMPCVVPLTGDYFFTKNFTADDVSKIIGVEAAKKIMVKENH